MPTAASPVATGLFRAAVPSGASTGIYEANEMRDNAREYMGKGVMKAVNNVNKIIAPALIRKNLCVTEQQAIDEFMVNELDGTMNKISSPELITNHQSKYIMLSEQGTNQMGLILSF
ncbi:unnamed protein product [Echinostoma caproni]|uniref:Enolase n=1 Tax=Echinostoma caproni TaxID=27848 RepID=A0A183AR08_9TREM|nr:unnamed protein product [Echinostoma caproni]